jgi:hypothetical protein
MTPWEGQPWLDLYRGALFELNPAELFIRIYAAEAAIKERISELKSSEGDNQELLALDRALCVMQTVLNHQRRRETVG